MSAAKWPVPNSEILLNKLSPELVLRGVSQWVSSQLWIVEIKREGGQRLRGGAGVVRWADGEMNPA